MFFKLKYSAPPRSVIVNTPTNTGNNANDVKLNAERINSTFLYRVSLQNDMLGRLMGPIQNCKSCGMR
jgi:hypothetical protein